MWHSNYLTEFNSIIIICFSTFSHHLRHHHRTTISGQDHKASRFLNDMDISLTLTFLQEFRNILLTFTTLIFIVFYLSPIVTKLRFVNFLFKRILDQRATLIQSNNNNAMSQIISKIIFVITTSNFRQIWSQFCVTYCGHALRQDNAPVHWARETVHLLTHETPEFIIPALWWVHSPDLNLIDYQI